ncbi:hypothetical protein PMAYCL1PPCAC_27829, partial [Pristionchus mayeri]
SLVQILRNNILFCSHPVASRPTYCSTVTHFLKLWIYPRIFTSAANYSYLCSNYNRIHLLFYLFRPPLASETARRPNLRKCEESRNRSRVRNAEKNSPARNLSNITCAFTLPSNACDTCGAQFDRSADWRRHLALNEGLQRHTF